MESKEEKWLSLGHCTVCSTAFKTPLASFPCNILVYIYLGTRELILNSTANLFSSHKQMVSCYKVYASSGMKTATLRQINFQERLNCNIYVIVHQPLMPNSSHAYHSCQAIFLRKRCSKKCLISENKQNTTYDLYSDKKKKNSNREQFLFL